MWQVVFDRLEDPNQHIKSTETSKGTFGRMTWKNSPDEMTRTGISRLKKINRICTSMHIMTDAIIDGAEILIVSQVQTFVSEIGRQTAELKVRGLFCSIV